MNRIRIYIFTFISFFQISHEEGVFWKECRNYLLMETNKTKTENSNTNSLTPALAHFKNTLSALCILTLSIMS